MLSGSQFDKDGNLQNWWNPDSYKGFAKRKECIINQYSSYKVPNTDLTVRYFSFQFLKSVVKN